MLNIVDTSYSGTYAPNMIMLEMFGLDTVEKGLVYVKSDIKKQATIPRIDVNNTLSPNQANPTDDGDTNGFVIDGRLLVPLDLQARQTFNPRDFEEDQYAEALSNTILAREVPATVESYMTQAFLNRSAESVETGIWQGSTAYLGHYGRDDAKFQLQYFNGFLQQFVNDAAINLSSISPVTITTSNILTILNDLIQQCTIKRKAMITDKKRFEKLKFIMSPTTGDIYGQALTTGTTYKGNRLDAPYISPWRGYLVETVAGMADNTIIFCRADESVNSNLWVGCNSTQDWQLEIKRVNNGNENFYILAKWKYCVQYGWSQEIFMYTTLTAANFLPAA